jgi:ribosome-associated translation inhibitor RaiA
MGNTERGKQASIFPVELHSQDLRLPREIVGYASEKVHVKLDKFGKRVTEVVLHIKDMNGRKGGVDKACHAEARLAHLAPVNVEERHHDLRAVIDLALDHLVEAVHRHTERARTRPRDQGRKVVRHIKIAH